MPETQILLDFHELYQND